MNVTDDILFVNSAQIQTLKEAEPQEAEDQGIEQITSSPPPLKDVNGGRQQFLRGNNTHTHDIFPFKSEVLRYLNACYRGEGNPYL